MMSRIPTVNEIDIDDAIVKSLNSYIYHNVHSRPYSEYRHNVSLHPLFQEPKVNIFHISSSSIRLPASGRWFLYTVEATGIVSVKLPLSSDEWTCLGDYVDNKTKERISGYCSSTGVDIRVVMSNYHCTIARHGVWILKHPKANSFIFAINEDFIDTMLDVVLGKPSAIDLNIYYHKEDEYFRVVGYNCSKLSERNTFFEDCIASSEYKKIITINGHEITPKNLTDIPEGAYGEIVYDSSIVDIFEVDFESAGKFIYADNKYAYKMLFHIPKALNIKNEILNHRICDFYVHPNRSNTNYYTNGIYINRTATDSQFSTITHNDFAINRALLMQYSKMTGDELSSTIKVVVRNHNKGFRLYKEPNFIRELYTCSDDTIINNLLEGSDNTFWYAKNIEDSKWAYFIDTYLEGITADKMEDCVNSLGYINSANAACSRVQHILISNELQKEFYIPVPMCFREEDELICHFFIDGLLQDNDHFKYVKSKQFLKITCDQYVPWTIGSRITVEMFEKVDYQAKEINLAHEESFSFVSKSGYVIYKQVDLSDTNTVDSKYIYNRFDVNTSYRELLDMEYDLYTNEIEDPITGDTIVTMRYFASFVRAYGVFLSDVQYYTKTTYGYAKVTVTPGATIPTGDTATKYFYQPNPTQKFLITTRYAYAKIYGVERHLKELNYDIWCSHMLKIKAKEFDEKKFVLTTDTEALSSKSYFMLINYKYYLAHYFTKDETFQKDKTYYLFKNEQFVEATVSPGVTIPENTYYEVLQDGDEIETTYNFYEVSTTSSSTQLSIPYLNTDRVLFIYLNGKELIEGLDYKDYTINTSTKCICGQFVVIQNVDYLRLVSNVFEVFTVNEKMLTLDSGFLTKAQTESFLSRMSFCNNIGQVFIDGVAKQYCNDPDFYVEINEAIRKGSSYKIRALAPYCITSKFDKITSIDTSTRNQVIKYLNDKAESSLEVTPITRSYHIYSTFLQTICEQILRKKLKYNLSWSDDRIKASLSPYLDMIEFDIALSDDNIDVTTKESSVKAPSKGLDFRFVDVLPSYRLERLEDSDLTITEKRPLMLISGSNLSEINGNYICMNPGIEYMRGTEAEHINNNAYKHWENNAGCYIEHKDGYWRLYTSEGVECYRAFDSRGIIEIWNLEWKPVEDQDSITINVVYVEVNTSNEFPTHRLQFTYTIQEHAYLTRIANMFLKKDVVKDGMNI